jgi:hypothetical protein
MALRNWLIKFLQKVNIWAASRGQLAKRLNLVNSSVVIWNIFVDVQLYRRESSEPLFRLIPTLTMLVDRNTWVRDC